MELAGRPAAGLDAIWAAPSRFGSRRLTSGELGRRPVKGGERRCAGNLRRRQREFHYVSQIIIGDGQGRRRRRAGAGPGRYTG